MTERQKQIRTYPPKDDRTYLYFIKSDSFYKTNKDLYKIGITNHLVRRLEALNVSSPYKLEIVYTKIFYNEKAKWIEHKLHEYFKYDKVKGEWFSFSSKGTVAINKFKEGIKLFEDPLWKLKECETIEDYYHMSGCQNMEREEVEVENGSYWRIDVGSWNNKKYRCPICGAPPSANNAKNYALSHMIEYDEFEYDEWHCYGEHKDYDEGDEYLEYYFDENFDKIMYYMGHLIKRKMALTMGKYLPKFK